jgi:S1-C subfamily serine protease
MKILAFFLGLVFSHSSLADVFRCVDAVGNVTYSNTSKGREYECRSLASSAPNPTPKLPASESRRQKDDVGKKIKEDPATRNRVFTGTAFAITKNLVVSNAHVVKGCDRIRTVNPTAVLSLKALDQKNDLALLETTSFFPVHAPMRLENPKTGEDVLLAGFPLVGILGQDLSVTRGVVSSSRASDEKRTNFTHTAPTQPGNSGGPIFDSYGRLIGVVVGKLNESAVMGLTGSIPQNVNIGITVGVLREFLDKYKVKYENALNSAPMRGEDFAEMALKFTVLVYCYRD